MNHEPCQFEVGTLCAIPQRTGNFLFAVVNEIYKQHVQVMDIIDSSMHTVNMCEVRIVKCILDKTRVSLLDKQPLKKNAKCFSIYKLDDVNCFTSVLYPALYLEHKNGKIKIKFDNNKVQTVAKNVILRSNDNDTYRVPSVVSVFPLQESFCYLNIVNNKNLATFNDKDNNINNNKHGNLYNNAIKHLLVKKDIAIKNITEIKPQYSDSDLYDITRNISMFGLNNINNDKYGTIITIPKHPDLQYIVFDKMDYDASLAIVIDNQMLYNEILERKNQKGQKWTWKKPELDSKRKLMLFVNNRLDKYPQIGLKLNKS